MIVFFLTTGQTILAVIQISILIFQHGMQSLVIELTIQPRTEHFLVWTSSKMAVDFFRAVTKRSRPKGGEHSTESICTYTRLVDIGSEA